VEEEMQGGVVQAVNFNAPGQVVIAGEKAAVERAIEKCKARGAKRAMPLPVSAPFHSTLMQPAADRLKRHIQSVAMAAPQFSVVNNVDVKAERDPARIKDALVRQRHRRCAGSRPSARWWRAARRTSSNAAPAACSPA